MRGVAKGRLGARSSGGRARARAALAAWVALGGGLAACSGEFPTFDDGGVGADAGNDQGDDGAAQDGTAADGSVATDGSSSTDATQAETGGSCSACDPGKVCCEAPLGCAGQCVPDCRLGAGGCPNGLSCDTSTGVCSPGGGPDGGPPEGGPPPDGGPKPDGGGPDGGPKPDGGPMPDGGASDAGGGDAASEGGTCVAGSTPVTGAGVAEAKISATSPWTTLHSGNFVGISGGTIAVGDQGLSGAQSGSVGVYVWDGCSSWTSQQTVTGGDETPYDMFGSSLSLVGDSLVVGANRKGSNITGSAIGAVYYFTRSGGAWTQVQELSPPTGAGYFGWSVAQTSTTLAVGSTIGKDPTSLITYSGIVSIYTLGMNGHWQYKVPLTPAEVVKNDAYGYATAIDGNNVISGAPGTLYDGATSSTNGKAWIFNGSGSSWTEAAYLTASDGAANDWFGKSVAISGDIAIVGAPNAAGVGVDGGAASNVGAAYVFAYDGANWSQQAKLTAADGADGDRFGFSVVTVSSTHVLVGAKAGKIYSFTRSGQTWTEDAPVYTACNGTVGYTLAVSGNLAVSAKGGAWVFDLADPSSACVGP